MATKKQRAAKVSKVMHEFKQGNLTTHGRKVTNRKQAIAIALSEARALNKKKKTKKKTSMHKKTNKK